jgi:hypothetical protein
MDGVSRVVVVSSGSTISTQQSIGGGYPNCLGSGYHMREEARQLTFLLFTMLHFTKHCLESNIMSNNLKITNKLLHTDLIPLLFLVCFR